jgi:beta-glucosidase
MSRTVVSTVVSAALALSGLWTLSCVATAAPPPAVFVTEGPHPAIYHDDYIDLNKNGSKDPYEDPKRPIEARIDDLVGRMTLEEKTAQMVTLYGFGRVLGDELPTPEWDRALWHDGIGNIDEQSNGNVGAEKPLPDPKYDFPWPLHVRALNEVQSFFIERTRLGIPVDFTNEGIRGLLHTRATSFPSQLGVAATWDRELVREIGRITGAEARALGYTNVYSPVLDLARDPRWGRTVETYGEDPFLVSELGLQQVQGIQQQHVVATLKHFAVYSIPKGGRDGDARTDPQATWSEVQSVFLTPFRRAIQEGKALGVMASYNDYNGSPVIASPLFLTEILRRQYGFAGYVVSDSGAVEFLHLKHRVAPTPSDAIRQAVVAGLNVRTHFTPPEAYVTPLRELVRSGQLPVSIIDARVRDILRVKYWLGLFDEPYRTQPEGVGRVVRSEAHRATAARADREAIVLLSNRNGALPLRSTIRKILVTGPLANDEKAWWCRYAPQQLDFVTPLAGIRARFAQAEVRYEPGVAATDAAFPASDVLKPAPPDAVRAAIQAAVRAAAGVEVVIAVVGEPGDISRESHSRVSLSLPGYQDELLAALHATGVPVIAVLSSGRPLSMNFAAERAAALLSIGYLGEGGGTALGAVLAGDYNPAGRLPITMPRSAGQVPFNFPYKPGSQDKDEGQLVGPLFPFGHGLSYTTFAYSGLVVEPARVRPGEPVSVRFNVKNTGLRAGEEVVQLYVRDDYSSVTTFERSLRGFERIALAAGEVRSLRFTLNSRDLELFDVAGRWVVEPGRFTVLVGGSSVDLRAASNFTVLTADGSAPIEAPLPAPVVQVQ